MNSNVFNTVLLGLIAVIILHFIYNSKNMNGRDNIMRENYEDDKLTLYDNGNTIVDASGKTRDRGTSGIFRTNQSKPWYKVANKQIINDLTVPNDKKKSKLVFDDIYEGVLEGSTDTKDTKFQKMGEQKLCIESSFIDVNGDETTVNEHAKSIKDYIKDRALNGNKQCECVEDKSKSMFTREQVNEYREKQLEFRDKIYGTSSPAIDAVDKINLVKGQGNIGGTGQTIASYYDSLLT